MKISDTIIKTEYDTVVALGFFDGVHLGHRKVIQTCVDNTDNKRKSVVFTFRESPHNAMSDTKKLLLTTNECKARLIESMGVDELMCVDFDSVKEMSSEEFVRDVLLKKLNAKCVVTGFNYRFSKGGVADADELKRLCDKYGITAIKCDPVLYKGESVSSTRIRQCISDGEIDDANNMLGYSFSVDNIVTSGNHIGTKIDSPTINQRIHDDIVVPLFGVYATKVTIDDKSYFGATNIGVHPTVGECKLVCETHLLDFDNSDLYGKRVVTELVHFIRKEKKFDSIDILRQQIEKDVENIREYFKNKSTV